MKKGHIIFLVLCCTVACLSLGCVENAILVKVKKDGSGRIVYRLLMADEMMSGIRMMAGAVSAAGEAGGASGLPSGDTMPTNLLKGIMMSLSSQMGQGVTFQSGREIDNDKGWKGFEGIYRFDDVTQLKIADLDPMGQGGGDMGNALDLGPKYRFAFTAGEEAVLQLTPVKRASSAPAAIALPTGLPAGMDPGILGAGMAGAMGGMMKHLVQGMRVSMVVSVDGEVIESNASYPTENRPNTFVLVDIPFDKILSDPKGMSMMTQTVPDSSELAKMDIPGLRVEDPDKTITVRFK